MTYKEQLLDPRWQKRRLEILERDEFRCQLCYDPGTTLHIHHTNYRSIMAWEYQDHELITYCKHCHSVMEYYKKIGTIYPAQVYKQENDGKTINLYMIGVNDESVFIDVFEYEENNLKYLLTMDRHSIYILNRIIKDDVLKETENG